MTEEEESFFRYTEAWRRSRSIALDHPLQIGDVLQSSTAVQFQFEAVIGPQYGTTRPQECPETLELVSPHCRLAHCDHSRPTAVRVVLKQPIHVGHCKWAQVWRADLLIAGSADLDVIVKIFHEALFPVPEAVDFYDGSLDTAAKLSHREGWAYEKLTPLQGTNVPYSFGFFHIKLPSGETVPAHIMEYVPGSTLYDYGQSIGEPHGNLEAQWAVLDRFAWSVHELHRLGVAHCDIRPPNVIVSATQPGRFVFLDFGHAEPAFAPNEAGDGMSLFKDAVGLVLCLDEIVLPSVLSAWFKERLQTPGLEWTEMMRCENGRHVEISLWNAREMRADCKDDFVERKVWS